MKIIKDKIVLWITLGCILMGAVSYDSSNPNAVIEEELKKLNENIENLIFLTKTQNSYSTEAIEIHLKTLDRILRSLQPNAFNMNGELIEN